MSRPSLSDPARPGAATTPPALALERHLPDPAASDRLAARLAPLLRAGDTLLLDGQIGAGKSHLARGMIRALGVTEDIPSPTYTLVQDYRAEGPGGPLEIWHADLYRLGDPGEVLELGLDEAMGRALCLVEWPALLGDHLPENALWLRLRVAEGDGRTLRIESGDPAWAERLALLGAA